MRWNPTTKAYDFTYARQLRREPEWSDKSLDQLLEMAFGDNYITRVDHEVVNRLRNHLVSNQSKRKSKA